jgi:hypothetical protein
MAIESFGTERDDIQGSKFQKYKGKAGNTDRVGIIPFEGKKFFKGAKCHFKDRMFLCKSTPAKKEICCTQSYEGNRPMYRISCVIIIYNLTTKDGKTKLKDYTLIPWIFREKMYQKLVAADKEFPLDQHDLKLTCSNEEFQTIDIQSCKESIWSSSPELRKKVLEEAAPLFEEATRNIGADLGLTEIREILGVDEPGATDAATDVDLGQVIDTIEQ